MQFWDTIKKIIMVLAVVLLVPAVMYAQILQEKNLDRPYEIRFNNCAGITDFQGVPISELHLFAYRGSEERWERVAFQIDELDVVGRPDSSDYFAIHNGLVDENDELVYLVRDAGDKVPVGVWIENEESKNYSRYEIEVADTTSGHKGWLYLFRTSTMTEEMPPAYMSVNGETGRIQSRYYEAGYDESSILQYFAITAEGGGTGTDILDRQKYYISGIFPPNLEYYVTENLIQVKAVNVVSGPVRVIRQTINNFVVTGADEPIIEGLKMTAKFTPYYLQYSSGAISFVELFGVERVRQTWDFNDAAEGMKFHSTNNRDILVDGIPDAEAISDTLEHNQLNWMMVTGEPGTVLAVNDLSFIGNSQRLYYLDDKANHPNDTGDLKSYGEMGVQVTGYRIADTLVYKSNIFFLPGNQPPEMGETMESHFASPVSDRVQKQGYQAGVADAVGKPAQFKLEQNYPNPFNPSTTIRFDLSQRMHVRLEVLNVLGQTIDVLIDEEKPSGQHSIVWLGQDTNGNKVGSGIYFYQLQGNGITELRKMILME